MSSFKDFHHKVKADIEQELSVIFDEQLSKAEKKDQVLVDSMQVLKEFVLRGGKRVGPMMVVLGYLYGRTVGQEDGFDSQSPLLPGSRLAFSPKGGDDSGENIFRLACAAEIHHLYLLNLDDMADRDELRHGGPTLEKYYREEVFASWKDSDHHGRTFSSINGALLNSLTFECVCTSRFSPQIQSQVIRTIVDHLFADTVVGWQIQYYQNNERIRDASEERFLKGLEYVTSRYKFVGPLKMGVIAAGPHLSVPITSSGLSSSPMKGEENQGGDVLELLARYGYHVGMAFQLQDDVMGVFGDPKEMGKAVGHDIREGKKTLLVQYAYHHGTDAERAFLDDVVGRALSEQELAHAQEIIQHTGALQYSLDLAHRHVADAVQAIHALPVQNVYTQIMTELAEYMVKRKA